MYCSADGAITVRLLSSLNTYGRLVASNILFKKNLGFSLNQLTYISILFPNWLWTNKNMRIFFPVLYFSMFTLASRFKILHNYPFSSPFGTVNWASPELSWSLIMVDVLWRNTWPSLFIEKRANWISTVWFSSPRWAGSQVILIGVCSIHFSVVSPETRAFTLLMPARRRWKPFN